MPALFRPEIDLIEELSYRRWARENYMPAEQRDAGWHPVILHEMACRDQELAEQFHREDMMSTAVSQVFVPLVPTITHFVHPSQTDLREPYFLSAPSPSGFLVSNTKTPWDIYEIGR